MNYKKDEKRSRPENVYVPQGYDGCQTPPYAITPLLPYLQGKTIWEPARGQGFLAGAMEAAGLQVISSSIETGQNFIFFHGPAFWNILITNPPYSIKYRWIERCYGLGNPFALLLPLDVLGTEKLMVLMEKYGGEVMLIRPRIDFKMPDKGWRYKGEWTGAQFPTFWLCWQLLPEKMMFANIKKEKKAWKELYLANPGYWESDGAATLTETYQQKTLF